MELSIVLICQEAQEAFLYTTFGRITSIIPSDGRSRQTPSDLGFSKSGELKVGQSRWNRSLNPLPSAVIWCVDSIAYDSDGPSNSEGVLADLLSCLRIYDLYHISWSRGNGRKLNVADGLGVPLSTGVFPHPSKTKIRVSFLISSPKISRCHVPVG